MCVCVDVNMRLSVYVYTDGGVFAYMCMGGFTCARTYECAHVC